MTEPVPEIGDNITFTRTWTNQFGMCEECGELPANYRAPKLRKTHFLDNDIKKPVTQEGFILCPICAANWASYGEVLERMWDDDEEDDDGGAEELSEKFTTLPNPDDETEGDRWMHHQTLDQPLNNVWTVVEGDNGGWYALTGYHIVNRLFHLVTEEPWTDADSEKEYRY